MQQKGSKMQFEALVAVLCALLHNAMCDVSKTHNVTSFHWRPSAWSGCVHRMPLTCCECYRTRRVDCIMVTGGTDVTSGRLVPPFYCRKYASSVLLYGEDGVHGGEVSVAGSVGMEEWGVGEMVVSGGDEAEERQACPACAQDCVLSVWSEWSSCRETCAPTVRQRIRRVLVASSLGGISCDSLGLVNTDDCVNLPHCTIIGPLSRLTPRYSWLAGPWTSCRVAPVGDTGSLVKFLSLFNLSLVALLGSVLTAVLCTILTQADINSIYSSCFHNFIATTQFYISKIHQCKAKCELC